MPAVCKYKRGPSERDMRGKVVWVTNGTLILPSIAWYIGTPAPDYRAHKQSARVPVVSLPVGHVTEEAWTTMSDRLLRGALVVQDETVYPSWQEAALAIFGALAVPYASPDAEQRAEQLIAAIERQGGVVTV
jgi:hypothetical protein